MPKNVLYLAENAISPIQGGGIVVCATFRGLPPANLLGFYTYTNITPSAEYSERFHSLRSPAEAAASILPGSPLSVLPPSRLRRLLIACRRQLKAIERLFAIRTGSSDWRLVDTQVRREGFRPDLVFSAPLSLRMLQLAVKTASAYSVPLVLLDMDDWIAQESSQHAPFSKAWRRRIAATMSRAKPLVAYAYSNSQRLADKLTREYEIPHQTMNNACADLLPGEPVWSPPPARNRTIISFAGALNWHLQGQTLKRVAEAVSELRLERDVELRIFTPWEFAPIANLISVPGAVTYGGFLPPSELVSIYLDSDYLLATTTFLEEEIHLFRHSLATKLSDYLCVGRPVISVGHRDWAVHDYVEEHSCGLAVRTPDRLEIKRRLLQALDTASPERHANGRRNRHLWERAHDVRMMAAALRELLEIDTPASG